MGTYVFDLFDWIEKQDPDTMPFRPGVEHTQEFGLRNSMEAIRAGASPGHLGNDRGRYPDTKLLMPFDGRIKWKVVGSVAGTLLQIIPEDDPPLELQYFHTERKDQYKYPLEKEHTRGEILEVEASNSGLSLGIHTHGELIVEYLPHRVEYLRRISTPIYYDGEVNQEYLEKHGQKYGIRYHDRETIKRKLKRQVKSWGIEELWDRFAVRYSLPEYRIPHWGDTKTIHMCTRTFLQI